MLSYILNNTDAVSALINCVSFLVAAYISIVLHEIAHGVVALWNGDYTSKYSGRLSLNPVKHFDLFGFLMFAVVGFGYAKPVPVNPNNFKNQKRGMFTVAIAGICMNIILAFVSSLLFVAMSACMSKATTSSGEYALYIASSFFEILMNVNLSLAFFNILPIYPLDGFRIVETFTRYDNKFCSFMRTNGQYLLIGLVLLGVVVDMATYVETLPYWFSYFDILGTYLNFFVLKVGYGGFFRLWFWVFF